METVIQLTAHSTMNDPKEMRRYAEPYPTSLWTQNQLMLEQQPLASVLGNYSFNEKDVVVETIMELSDQV